MGERWGRGEGGMREGDERVEDVELREGEAVGRGEV